MSNELKTARVKATGKIIEVYRHSTGTWIDYSDCNTEYQKHEVIIQS